jgi:hypothetical protein
MTKYFHNRSYTKVFEAEKWDEWEHNKLGQPTGLYWVWHRGRQQLVRLYDTREEATMVCLRSLEPRRDAAERKRDRLKRDE